MARDTAVEAAVPGDKSITHRALFLSALAEGESRLTGLLDSADTRATRSVLTDLGAELAGGPDEVMVAGKGLRGLRTPDGPLDCGNSGTTARFLLGVLAGSEAEAVVTGDASLRVRPMARVTAPLTACGAAYEELGEAGRLPIRVRGSRALSAIDVVNTRSSAQVKTALLLAGLAAGVPVRVTETGRPRDHTERMLAAMGASIRTARAAAGDVVTLEPSGTLAPLRLTVPGDLSSAAFFLALGALRSPVRVRGLGLNPTRSGALDVLERMGARVAMSRTGEAAGEPVGDVLVAPGGLSGCAVAAEEVPGLLDEVPVLAVVAARAEGETRFEGVAELRVKETDRIDALARNLRALGVEVDDGPDHLAVVGTDRPLEGIVDAFGDHRIAMAFGILNALADQEIRILGGDAVRVSYPGFWEELERVTKRMEAA